MLKLAAPNWSSYRWVFQRPLITDLLQYAGDEWVQYECKGNEPCYYLKAEVTPDGGFYVNPYFSISTGESALLGKRLCTYGPWVTDQRHDDHPEIHPSELYWWRESKDAGNQSDGAYFLMLLQDDSNRFDRTENFNFPSDVTPPWFRPWSQFPRTGEFKIAFELNPKERPLIYDITSLSGQRVLTPDKDSDDGFEHAIMYDGKLVLIVKEPFSLREAVSDEIEVRFVKVCRNKANNRLQGYIAITSKVGLGDRGEEGFHLLRVDRSQEKVARKRVTVTVEDVSPVPKSPAAISTPMTVLLNVDGEHASVLTSFTEGYEGSPNLSIMLKELTTASDLEINIDISRNSGAWILGAGLVANYVPDENYGAGTHTTVVSGSLVHRKFDPSWVTEEGNQRPSLLPKIIEQAFKVTYRIDVQDIGVGDISTHTSQPKQNRSEISLRGKIMKESLQRASVNGQDQIVVDMEVHVIGSEKSKDNDLQVSKSDFVTDQARRELAISPFKVFRTAKLISAIGVVRNLPIFKESAAHLEHRMKSGVMAKQSTPKISLAPIFLEEKAQPFAADRAMWRNIVTAIGGTQVPSEPSAELIRIPRWQLEILPVYAPVRAGKISPEEVSPLAEELNDIIYRKDKARFIELFGENQPFRVEWTFKATNLATGSDVPVKVGQAASEGEIRVDLSQGKLPEGRIQINFPEQPANVIYEFVATAKMTDTFGNAATSKYHIWNHVLSVEPTVNFAEKLLPSIANMAGVSASKLIEASNLDNPPDQDRIIEDSSLRQARLIRMMAMRAAQDKSITIAELRRLVRSVELFGSL